MKTVTILYYAALKEATHKSEEIWSTEALTAKELYRELSEAYHFPLKEGDLRVAINDDFTGMDQKLQSGDLVAFIPPVAGG